MLKEWFEECLRHGRGVAKLPYLNDYAVIYKGFRILYNKEGNDFSLQDVRVNEFYSEVKNSDLQLLKEHGFIKGCDIIMMRRDELRVEHYTKKLEKLYKNKIEYTKNKDEKKLKICKKSIHDYIDLLFFYKTRLNQLKKVYNAQ